MTSTAGARRTSPATQYWIPCSAPRGANRQARASRDGVAHDLVLDAVGIEEIEATAGHVGVVAERPEARRHDLRLDGLEIVDLDPDMIERPALGEVVGRVGDIAAGIEREVLLLGADMDGVA